jgi:hypothetical protein
VFRQLVEERLVDPAGHLNGQPWGTVNYHPGKCGGGEHLHVVWETGGELRRAAVYKPNPVPKVFYTDSASAWPAAAVMDGWRPTDPKVLSQYSDRDPQVSFDQGTVEIWLTRDTPYATTSSGSQAEEIGKYQALRAAGWTDDQLTATPAYGTPEYEQQKAPGLSSYSTRKGLEAEATLRRMVSDAGYDPDDVSTAHARLRDDVNREIVEIRERAERHLATWDDLCALPQLFIAV